MVVRFSDTCESFPWRSDTFGEGPRWCASGKKFEKKFYKFREVLGGEVRPIKLIIGDCLVINSDIGFLEVPYRRVCGIEPSMPI